MKHISVNGTAVATGTYVLRMQVIHDLHVRFGRFRDGAPIPLSAGHYVYVGSAMRGLGPRVLRHATRSTGAPHAIYKELQTICREQGLVRSDFRPRAKRLHWHVDYLLEETAVALTHLLLVRTPQSLEKEIAGLLAADPAAVPPASGLGAGDHPGQTHLLRVPDTSAWWARLISKVDRLLG